MVIDCCGMTDCLISHVLLQSKKNGSVADYVSWNFCSLVEEPFVGKNVAYSVIEVGAVYIKAQNVSTYQHR